MTFSIRDLCWLILVICVGLGAWRTASQRTEARISEQIHTHGFFEDQKRLAVMFPLKDSKWKQKAMMRVWTKSDDLHDFDIYYPDSVVAGGNFSSKQGNQNQ